jgi:hypothetical protein
MVVFKVLACHTNRVLHVTDMFWGCCPDSLIVKAEEAVREVMDGHYSTLPFSTYATDGTHLTDHGKCWSSWCGILMLCN